MPTEGQDVPKTGSHLRHVSVCIPLFLAFVVGSNAQVSIKERVSIRPSSLNPPSVSSIEMSLEPISFSFGECGSLEGELDSRYNDRIFIPRDGGIIGMSFDSRYGRALDGWAGACPETLLVFDQSGALISLYSFMPWQYETVELYGDTIQRPRIQHYLPVRQWEPLRFRLLVHACEGMHPDQRVVLLPNVNAHPCFNTVLTDFPGLYTPNIQDKYGGLLVFRTGAAPGLEDTCYWYYDDASIFPMEYIEYDPTANGPMPLVESDFPIQLSITGPYRLVITDGNSEVEDFVRMLQPRDTLLFSNVTAHVGETVSLGTLAAGTLVQFTNGRGLVCREPLGVSRWALTFESGTDLRFDDFQALLELDVGYPDHLEVRAGSDTVWYGDTAAVTILPVDDQGRLSPIANDWQIEYSVELFPESQPYATLRYSDTVGPLVERIPSTQAVGRGVQLIATGVEPESTVTLQFHLKANFVGEILPSSVRTLKTASLRMGNAAKKNAGTYADLLSVRRCVSSDGENVVMENDWAMVEKNNNKLLILDHSPWSIWPSLPPTGKGKSRGADRPGYNPKRSFRIQVTDGRGRPLANREIEVTTAFEEQSGGHLHGFGQVQFPQGVKQGLFYGQGGQGVDPISLTTDQNGTAVIDSFLASQVSGKYLVTASVVSSPAIRDTVNLAVKVPGLVNFMDLIVLDERPFIPSQSDTGKANHPSNTWCTPEMGDSLFLAVLDFYEWTQTEEEGGKAIQTSINDMSLPWGGYFDIKANFDIQNPSHSFHRVGLSVDINRGSMDKNAIGYLTKFMKQHRGIRHIERPQIHYGFNGGN